MGPSEIHARLSAKFGDRIVEFKGDVLDPYAVVAPASIEEVCKYLYEDDDLKFDSLMCLSGVDSKANLDVVYHLFSMPKRHKFTLKVSVPKEASVIPTVSHIWRTADWHEREAYDLFGIRFDGHPDLRRILLPDDWDGYPLRKDYVVQEYYHGMKVPY
jgi:NADH-quinone oxidoreductase subunit C